MRGQTLSNSWRVVGMVPVPVCVDVKRCASPRQLLPWVLRRAAMRRSSVISAGSGDTFGR